MFEISIGDNDNWSKWVQAKIVVWGKNPGNQVEYALVGNDVTDQLAYAHEPRKSIKFLDPQDVNSRPAMKSAFSFIMQFLIFTIHKK